MTTITLLRDALDIARHESDDSTVSVASPLRLDEQIVLAVYGTPEAVDTTVSDNPVPATVQNATCRNTPNSCWCAHTDEDGYEIPAPATLAG